VLVEPGWQWSASGDIRSVQIAVGPTLPMMFEGPDDGIRPPTAVGAGAADSPESPLARLAREFRLLTQLQPLHTSAPSNTHPNRFRAWLALRSARTIGLGAVLVLVIGLSTRPVGWGLVGNSLT
jgi:hypothetical protein